MSRSTASRAVPSRPAALRRGARAKPMSGHQLRFTSRPDTRKQRPAGPRRPSASGAVRAARRCGSRRCSGTTSATVPSAARPTASSRELAHARRHLVAAARLLAQRPGQLERHPRAAQAAERVVVPGRRGCTNTRRRGSVAFGSWWSVMMRSRPSPARPRRASAPPMPQSTVTTSETPPACDAAMAATLQTVAVFEPVRHVKCRRRRPAAEAALAGWRCR